MKYLTNYKIFEYKLSNFYRELDNITKNLKDMVLEFEDNDCEIKIDQPLDFGDPLYLEIALPKSLIKKISDNYSPKENKALPDWFIENLYQIDNYLESEGTNILYSVENCMSNYNKQGDYIISYNNHYSFNYELKDIPLKILTITDGYWGIPKRKIEEPIFTGLIYKIRLEIMQKPEDYETLYRYGKSNP